MGVFGKLAALCGIAAGGVAQMGSMGGTDVHYVQLTREEAIKKHKARKANKAAKKARRRNRARR